MDHCVNKRHARGLMTRKKGYASLKDVATEEDPSAQFCNRIGCQGRIKYGQTAKGVLAKSGSMNELKVPKSSSRSSNGNEMIEKSTRSSSVITRSKKSNPNSKRKSSPSKFDPSESRVSSKSEVLGLMSLPSSRTESPSESLKSADVMGTECESSSVSSNARPWRIFHHKSNIQNQNIPPASAVPLASRSSYSLRNMKCNSVSSNNMPARHSSLQSDPVGKNKMIKRSCEGESSLPRRAVDKTNGTSYVSTSTSGVRISNSSHCSNSSGEDNSRTTATVLPRRSTNDNTRTMLLSRQNGTNNSSVRQHIVSKKTLHSVSGCSSSDSRRSIFSGEESSSTASVRNRRSTNENNRIKPSSRQNGRNSLSIRQHAVGIPHVPGNEIPSNGPNPLRQFPASGSRSYSLSGSSSDNPSTAMARDYFYGYNIDGISEVLLALEGIEQDELTHELLSSLNIYDQHRDMRLDIDNMSYEELLALEERMGSVSTALSEEALENCIKKSSYQPTTSNLQTMGCYEDGDDIKCSICQEEYLNGDEIGKLVECQHRYHVACINQWLRMKNWCPVCKAEAACSQSP